MYRSMTCTLFLQALEYTESHACLKIKLPRHLLLRRQSEQSPPKDWKSLDSAFATVYVNKTTGAFVSPEAARCGDWRTLQNFLLAWQADRASSSSPAKASAEGQQLYPELGALDLDAPASEVAREWEGCVPVESLSAQEFKEVLRALKLPLRSFKVEDFVRFEARVPRDTMDQLVFPVRYLNIPVKSFVWTIH